MGQVPCFQALFMYIAFRDDNLKVGIEIEKEEDYNVLVCNKKYTYFI